MNKIENLVNKEQICFFQQFARSSMEKYGYDIYFVGGMVRDSIIFEGQLSDGDIDITGSLNPEEFVFLLNSIQQDGLIQNLNTVVTEKVGTVFVKLSYEKLLIEFEYTPFRNESDYKNSRSPSVVNFSRNIEDDYKRRDFTINSIYFSINQNKYIDFVNGISDIKNKTIRCIGNSEERLKEDYLRILRALRFSAKFSFKIEDDTFKSMIKTADGLDNISMFRIVEEFGKGFASSKFAYVELLQDFGLALNNCGKVLSKLSFQDIIKKSCFDPMLAVYFFSKTDRNSFILFEPYLGTKGMVKYYEIAYDILHRKDKYFDNINNINSFQDFHKYLYMTSCYHLDIDEYINVFEIIHKIDISKDFMPYLLILKKNGIFYDINYIKGAKKDTIISFIQDEVKDKRIEHLKDYVFENFIKVEIK